jgi:glutamyl-tRNA reductase
MEKKSETNNLNMSVVFIGSGNVAWHMSQSLHKVGHKILQVYSRNFTHAEVLAKKVNAEAIDRPETINQNADAYIISVSDDSISVVAETLHTILRTDNPLNHV